MKWNGQLLSPLHPSVFTLPPQYLCAYVSPIAHSFNLERVTCNIHILQMMPLDRYRFLYPIDNKLFVLWNINTVLVVIICREYIVSSIRTLSLSLSIQRQRDRERDQERRQHKKSEKQVTDIDANITNTTQLLIARHSHCQKKEKLKKSESGKNRRNKERITSICIIRWLETWREWNRTVLRLVTFMSIIRYIGSK